MTRKEVLEAVLKMEEVKANAEMTEVLTKMIEQVSKKRVTETPVQKANKELVEKIYNFMVEAGKAVTAKEVMEFLGEGFSSQKTSALLKKLVDAERIVRAKEGKVTVYTVA